MRVNKSNLLVANEFHGYCTIFHTPYLGLAKVQAAAKDNWQVYIIGDDGIPAEIGE